MGERKPGNSDEHITSSDEVTSTDEELTPDRTNRQGQSLDLQGPPDLQERPPDLQVPDGSSCDSPSSSTTMNNPSVTVSSSNGRGTSACRKLWESTAEEATASHRLLEEEDHRRKEEQKQFWGFDFEREESTGQGPYEWEKVESGGKLDIAFIGRKKEENPPDPDSAIR